MTGRRKHIPVGVKLEAALLALGFTSDQIASGEIEWDHYPALALRLVDPDTGELVPAANDPAHIRPMLRDEHKAKTSGRRGEKRSTSYGSDLHAIAKERRSADKNAEFCRAMAAKGACDLESKPKRKHHWPSRPMGRRAGTVERR